MDPYARLVCRWCNGQNANPGQCVLCGAPLDGNNVVTESGWREAPRLRDMTVIRFGHSTCQVEGELVPVVELGLAAGDAVYFEHHCMLWKTDSVPLAVMNLQGPKRSFFRMPHIVTIASGPGSIAFSRDAAGEIVVLPLHPQMEVDVREHAFLLASMGVSYSYVRIKGLGSILRGASGMWLDRFVTGQYQGLLVLHGYGNVFERFLAPGESIQVEPGSVLYKDASVALQPEGIQLSSGFFGGTTMYLARLTGPGRVGIQSMYHHHESGE
ncbi:MAG TPA: AIM24 family protein [Polyangiaceae bacterium]|nr:AIM24 family protein [Polyangiaceae bacterium]